MSGNCTVTAGHTFTPDASGKTLLERSKLNLLGQPDVKVGQGQITDLELDKDNISIQGGMIDDEAITTEKLADEAVSEEKIADDSVSSAKIQDGAIGTAKLEDNAVTTEKIKDGAITEEKLDSDAFNNLNYAHVEKFEKVGLANNEQWNVQLEREDRTGARIAKVFKSIGGGDGIFFDEPSNFDREDLIEAGITAATLVKDSTIYDPSDPTKYMIFKAHMTGIVGGVSHTLTLNDVASPVGEEAWRCPRIRPGCNILRGTTTGFIKSIDADGQSFTYYCKVEEFGTCQVFGTIVSDSLEIGALSGAIIDEMSTFEIPKVPDPKSRLPDPPMIMNAGFFAATNSYNNQTPEYAFDWELTESDMIGTATKKAFKAKIYKGARENKAKSKYAECKIMIEFPSSILLRQIKYVNYNTNTTTKNKNTTIGVKKFDLYGSNTRIIQKDDGKEHDMFLLLDPYDTDGWEKINVEATDDETGIELDEFDRDEDLYKYYVLPSSHKKTYRYYALVLKENYGDSNEIGFRHMEFQGYNATCVTGTWNVMSNDYESGYDSGSIASIGSANIQSNDQNQSMKFLLAFSTYATPSSTKQQGEFKYYDPITDEWESVAKYDSGSAKWQYKSAGGTWTDAPTNSKASALYKAIEAGWGMTEGELEGYTFTEFQKPGGFSSSIKSIHIAVGFYSYDAAQFPTITSFGFNSEEWEEIEDMIVSGSAATPALTKRWSGLQKVTIIANNGDYALDKLRLVVVTA